MKTFPSNLLLEIEKQNKKINPILFYGNEWGLISASINSVYNFLQKKLEIHDIKHFNYKNIKNDELKYILNDSSLFSKINLVILKGPQEKLITELENIGKIDNILIVNGENLQTKSKIISYFNNNKNFMGVPCYQLDKNYIKKTIDNFVKINEIKLQNEAYWFLVDNISEDYLTLENELEKLNYFKKTTISLEILQKLIAPKGGINNNGLFFKCATGDFKSVLQAISFVNKSINESYEILLSLKKFIHILSSAVVNKDRNNLDDLVNIYLPKYLFLKKEIFRDVLKKTSLNKVAKINSMLQKTEYLFRKNSEQHREVLERFLLNLTKIMR